MTRRRTRSEWGIGQRLKNDVLFWLARSMVSAVRVLPAQALAPLGRTLGGLAFHLLREARRTAEANLGLAYPELPAETCRALAREGFRTLGADLGDTLRLLRSTEMADATLDLPSEADSALRGALGRGRGVVYITAHLGPWERMAALLSARGFPITTVARESYDARFHALLYDPLRAARGVDAIYRGAPGAPFAIVRALRAGRVVGFPSDLPGRVPCGPVKLLGRDSRLPIGPARIALRTRSAIVVGTPAPAQGGSSCSGPLRLRIEELLIDDLQSTPEDEKRLLQRIADTLSERIRALPLHWPWMHPSFRTLKAERIADVGQGSIDFHERDVSID